MSPILILVMLSESFNYPIQGPPIFGNGLEVAALHCVAWHAGGASHQGLSCHELEINEEENGKIR